MKQQRSTMADLGEDVILEILARLPLKDAVRCSTLSKAFRDRISNPTFRRRLFSPHLAGRPITFFYSRGELTRFEPRANPVFHGAVTLPLEFTLLSSCNGVLFFSLFNAYPYYVFNPVTGEIACVHECDIDDHTALAVDDHDPNIPFKLVTVDRKPAAADENIFAFTVFVPAAGGIVAKSQVEIAYKGYFCARIRPVYSHGSVYWLAKSGKEVMTLDLDNGKPGIINGPVNGEEINTILETWFGLIDGSISFVYIKKCKIIFVVLDQLKNEWEVKHYVSLHEVYLPWPYSQFTMSFFDGRHLYLRERMTVPDGRDLFVLDVFAHTWKRCRDGDKVFFQFSPTAAKVSDKYLHKLRCENIPLVRNALVALQQLVISYIIQF